MRLITVFFYPELQRWLCIQGMVFSVSINKTGSDRLNSAAGAANLLRKGSGSGGMGLASFTNPALKVISTKSGVRGLSTDSLRVNLPRDNDGAIME